MSHRGTGIFTSLMALLFVALLGFGIAGYVMGWMTINHAPDQTTIEINTQEIEKAAHEAQQEGSELMEDAGKKLRETGAALEEAS